MATEYKNILLKDASGKILLPITFSYYVEYKDGISVKSYLDTLSSDIENINNVIADQSQFNENITATVNDIISSYIDKPDHARDIVFDNSYNSLSDSIKNLENDTEVSGESFVSIQKVIETIDSRISENESYITGINSTLQSHNSKIESVENELLLQDAAILNASNKINEIFDNNGDLDIMASAIQYEGNVASGTSGIDNVQSAIDDIGTRLVGINTSIEAALSSAGVTYVKGTGGILVNGLNNTERQGSVNVSVNVGQNGKLKIENGVVTVDETKLDLSNVSTYASNIVGKIQATQIEGDLTADNINISYSYTDINNIEHDDGIKSIQDFYDETMTVLSELQTATDNLDNNYILSITDDAGEDSSYARVYTIKQGTVSYTINIPKDQFLRNVEYDKVDGSYALIFTWNLSDNDNSTGAPTSYVPIADFIDAITGDISEDIIELSAHIIDIDNAINAIESTYITGAVINGEDVDIINHKLQLQFNILYDEGNSIENVSQNFLLLNGIS